MGGAEQRNPIMMRFPDLSCLEAAEMFVSNRSLLGDQLGDLTGSLFNQLKEFVNDDEVFERHSGESPNRTD